MLNIKMFSSELIASLKSIFLVEKAEQYAIKLLGKVYANECFQRNFIFKNASLDIENMLVSVVLKISNIFQKGPL